MNETGATPRAIVDDTISFEPEADFSTCSFETPSCPAKTQEPARPSMNLSLSRDELIKRLDKVEHELAVVRDRGKQIAQELDLFRQRRAIFWSDRFRNSFNAWNLMNHGFQQLKDDTALFNANLKGYRLQPSLSLLRVPYLTYKISAKRKGLSGILLAPVTEIPLCDGEICIQILDMAQTLLVSKSVPVTEISGEKPTEFRFEPLSSSDMGELTLKIYAQGVDAPIRVFEMRRYGLGGFGKLKTRIFAGFEFEGAAPQESPELRLT